jgi:hypothetical protein
MDQMVHGILVPKTAMSKTLLPHGTLQMGFKGALKSYVSIRLHTSAYVSIRQLLPHGTLKMGALKSMTQKTKTFLQRDKFMLP